MDGVEVDQETAERWRSYQYRRLMHVTEEEYGATSALTVDWDLELAKVEERVKAKRLPKPGQPTR